MKKNLFVLFLFALFLLPCIALADGGQAPTTGSEFYTWTYLGTMAGAAAATLLIVQFTKAPLDRVWKIPTRWFTYIVALAILLLATAFTDGLSLDKIPLILLNAFLVALSAYGSYDLTFSKK